jgi:CO/xanthine dehydrogenase Mo-binding subunit
MGEIGIVGTAAAIADAIFHTTGKGCGSCCPSPSTSC